MSEVPTPGWFVPFAVVVYGLIFGSFLNVVIHRLPRGESPVRPRSRCPGCGELIRWWQNVPIVSYVLLLGRCASCRAPISLRYPVIEAVSALSMLLVWARFGLSLPFFIYAPYTLAMLALFVIDLEHQLLPDAITKPGTVLGLIVSPWNPHVTIVSSVVGAVLGYGVLWLLAEGYVRYRGEEGLGGGDLKLAAMIGAFTGWKGVLEVMLAGSLLGVVFGLALILLRRADMKTALPFGCFLAPAAVLVALAGADPLWANWQLAMLRLWGLEPPAE